MKDAAIVTALVIGILALGIFGGAWVLMLVLGGLSHIMAIPSLAIGFWACVLIDILLGFLGSVFRSSK